MADLCENFFTYREEDEDAACLVLDELPLFFRFLTIPPPPPMIEFPFEGMGLLAVVEASSLVRSPPGPVVMFKNLFDY